MNITKKIIECIEEKAKNYPINTIIVHTDKVKEVDTQLIFSSTAVNRVIFSRNYDSYKSAIEYEFPNELIIIYLKYLDPEIEKSINERHLLHYAITPELMQYSRKSSRKVEAKEFKLLTDIIWGWDLNKLNWILSEEDAEFITKAYQSNIFPLYNKRTAVTGETIDALTGYALLVPINMTLKQ